MATDLIYGCGKCLKEFETWQNLTIHLAHCTVGD